MKGNHVSVVAQPYLRAWRELNETDIKSYQALVDIFHKEGVLKQSLDVRTLILKSSDFA
jgi:NitT/TauT family transport system substrate-binding protein